MSKPIKFTIYKVDGKNAASVKWRIYIPVRIFGGAKSKFVYFSTRAARLMDALNGGDVRGRLSAAQCGQAEAAFAVLSAAGECGIDVSGVRLVDCVQFMLEHHVFAGGNMSIAELAQAYYDVKSHLWSVKHRSNVRGYMTWITKRFEGLRAAELTKEVMVAWFGERFGSVVAYNAAHRVYSAMFTWAVTQGELKLSPMLGVERRRERRKDTVDVLSLDDVGRLFEACADWRDSAGHPMADAGDGSVSVNYLLDCSDCVLPFAVQLFAGLRPAEFERILWEDVLLEQGLIRVLPSVSKTGRLRLVPIAAVLRGLLEAVPLSGRVRKLAPKNWKRKRYVVVKAAGLEGRHDVLRHSFASYHLAMWRDIGLLREAMGHEHGSKMTFDHYLTAVLPSEAPRYWGWVF